MKTFKSIIAILSAAAVLASCSLVEDNERTTKQADFYKTTAQCRAALNGCYIPLTSIYSLAYMIAVEGTTDVASTDGSAQKDAKLDINPNSTGCGNNVWQQCYVGVRNCNAVIECSQRSEMSAKELAPIIAEAKILRAYYYYLLTSFFGNVPFYEDYIETEDKLVEIGRLPRMDANATRATLVKEMRECCPDLDQVRTCDIRNAEGECMNYAGAAMGWMMMAKLAAWNKDWNSVVEAVGHLESIYGLLSDYPLSDIPFCMKNTPESIFEIQHTYTPGGLSKTSSIACVCMPYPRTAGTNNYNGVPVDYLGDQATTYAPLRPTGYYTNSIMPEKDPDLRRDYNLAVSWKGLKFSRIWMGIKFWCPNLYTTNDSNNQKVFRYADALLLKSEALCELGNYTESLKYLNMTKSRAEANLYTKFRSQVKLMDEIRKERARELFGEFQRKYDLVRWGIWYSQVCSYNTYSVVQNNIRPCHEYYPIPDSQVMASGGALDNRAYESGE